MNCSNSRFSRFDHYLLYMQSEYWQTNVYITEQHQICQTQNVAPDYYISLLVWTTAKKKLAVRITSKAKIAHTTIWLSPE